MQKNKIEIANKIDHAILSPSHTYADFKNGIETAKKHGVCSVCVYPSAIRESLSLLRDTPVKVGTVLDFPFGRKTTKMRVGEAIRCVRLGAEEIDIVVRQDLIRGNSVYYHDIIEDLNEIFRAVKKEEEHDDVVLKLIIETCSLDLSTIKRVCTACSEVKPNFIKTSTGFGSKGADRDTIPVIATASRGCQIKASGGIKTLADVEDFLNLGCARIGTSNTEKIMEEWEEKYGYIV